jgi:hypothetical protein
MFMHYADIGVGHNFSVTTDDKGSSPYDDEQLADHSSIEHADGIGDEQCEDTEDGDSDSDNNELEDTGAQDDLDDRQEYLGPEDGKGGWDDIEGEEGFGEL